MMERFRHLICTQRTLCRRYEQSKMLNERKMMILSSILGCTAQRMRIIVVVFYWVNLLFWEEITNEFSWLYCVHMQHSYFEMKWQFWVSPRAMLQCWCWRHGKILFTFLVWQKTHDCDDDESKAKSMSPIERSLDAHSDWMFGILQKQANLIWRQLNTHCDHVHNSD